MCDLNHPPSCDGNSCIDSVSALVATPNKRTRNTYSRIPLESIKEDRRIPRRQQAVEDNLSPSLKRGTKRPYIGEDHKCFELDSVVEFREEYQIDPKGNQWKNFKRLLCGYQDLPFIILQNPTNKHDSAYDEMRRCPTIQWISAILVELGLALEDVVVVDICSLLSDKDLQGMGRELRSTWDAVEKSYAMVEGMLEFLNPGMVISCQCVTLGSWGGRRIGGRLKRTWEPAVNTLARDLCSSQKLMAGGEAKEIKVGSNSTLCVYGVHPRRLKFNKDMIPELRGAFMDLFVPCMRWSTGGEEAGEVPAPIKSDNRRGVLLAGTRADRPDSKALFEIAVAEKGISALTLDD